MHAPDRIRVVRVALRVSLAAGFLSAVADRFGWWEPFGQGSWGGMGPFADYAHQLAPFASGWLLTVIVWAATAAEATLGVLLLTGWRPKLVGRGDLLGAHNIWNHDGCIPWYGITAQLQCLLRSKCSRRLRGTGHNTVAAHPIWR